MENAENVDLVVRLLEAFEGGDMETMLSCLDQKAELHSAIVGGAEGSIYHGHDGFRSWYANSYETFESFSFDWSEFRDLGDRVLALGQMQARGRESGVELDSPMGWVLAVQHGKVVRAQGFLNRNDALTAAGLTAEG